MLSGHVRASSSLPEEKQEFQVCEINHGLSIQVLGEFPHIVVVT